MTERARGWWYPYIFVAMLGTVMLVNGGMAYFAVSTFNGVITENAYEKGISYNKTLNLARQQANLGWVVEAALVPASQGHGGTLTVRFVDKDGHGVDGLDVQALADHPNVTGEEQRMRFVAAGDGQYRAELTLPNGGQWSFDILATREQATYQFQRRFLIP
jgi:nitrogen fixation protein FixH